MAYNDTQIRAFFDTLIRNGFSIRGYENYVEEQEGYPDGGLEVDIEKKDTKKQYVIGIEPSMVEMVTGSEHPTDTFHVSYEVKNYPIHSIIEQVLSEAK